MKQKTKVVLFLLSLSTFFNPLKAQSLQQLYDLADHYNQQIVVSQTGLRAASEAVMKQLIAYNVLPEGTEIRSISVMNGTATIDAIIPLTTPSSLGSRKFTARDAPPASTASTICLISNP